MSDNHDLLNDKDVCSFEEHEAENVCSNKDAVARRDGDNAPKEKYLNALADIFEVSPHALAVPDIDSYVGLMHTLFTLEDLYGLHIDEIDGELCLRLDKSKGTTYLSMFDMFHAWQEQAEKLKSGEITQEEYDQWRYNYPKNAK